MKIYYRIYLLLSVFILCSCAESEKEKYNGFTEKKGQTTTERTFQDLTLVDSLNISKELNEQSLSYIRHNKNSIFAKLEEQIIKVNKQDLNPDTTFTLPEGRGPGEVINFNVVRFEVGEKGITVYDGKAQKTILYDLNGNFREEFLNGAYSVSAMVKSHQDSYYFMVQPGREYLFYEVKRKENGSEILRQFQQQPEDINILAYTGEITYHNNSLYYGGYSEPLIRRYDLSGEEVELIFSRAVIDDYNSENNYEQPQQTPGGGRFWRYAEEAKYASEDIAADHNYLYSVRHHNDTEGYKYLDVYNTDNGDYLGSFVLKYYPYEILVDDDYIYTREAFGSTRYLIKYRKPKINF